MILISQQSIFVSISFPFVYRTGNWKKITEMVGTRSCTQIRTHAQKYFIALQKPINDSSTNGVRGESGNGGGGGGGGGGGYARKKSKMLIGADHHLNSNIKTGSSAIITGYGGGGTPIHPSRIIPVTSGVIVDDESDDEDDDGGGGGGGRGGNKNQQIKQFWGPDGLRDNNTGLTGMEVLAQAAITENIGVGMGVRGIEDHAMYNQYESSLDKAVAELRKKIANDADAAASAKNAGGSGSNSSDINAAKEAVAQAENETDAASVLAHHAALAKQKREEQVQQHQHQQDQHVVAARVGSSYHAANAAQVHHEQQQRLHLQLQQQQLQQQLQGQQQQQHKKMKLNDGTSNRYGAGAVQDTMDQRDVIEKLQAVAERQEFLRLRQEGKNLNHTILALQQQNIESDSRIMEAITDRRVALNECKNLQEINAQLKTELRRMVMLFEQTGNNSSALMAAATRGANTELMQARLTESELRYHTVTESLSRQTGVLTDQHRAILELNSQLERERVKRQALEYELKQVKSSQHNR